MAACFPEDKIRTTGRNSMGVRGIKLRNTRPLSVKNRI